MKTITLLNAATTTATGTGYTAMDVRYDTENRVFQATVSGTGAVSATVNVEVSNDNTNWLVLGTITLSGTTSASDGFAAGAPWPYTRARVTAISGTSAAVTVSMGF